MSTGKKYKIPPKESLTEVVSWLPEGETFEEDLYWEWICMAEELQNKMEELDDKGEMIWGARVENFGWRKLNGLSGPINLRKEDAPGLELLKRVLPRTDCRFTIYTDGKALYLNNFHHDSPTGREWYAIVPMRTIARELAKELAEKFGLEKSRVEPVEEWLVEVGYDANLMNEYLVRSAVDEGVKFGDCPLSTEWWEKDKR
jgi:hypothetical protein